MLGILKAACGVAVFLGAMAELGDAIDPIGRRATKLDAAIERNRREHPEWLDYRPDSPEGWEGQCDAGFSSRITPMSVALPIADEEHWWAI